MTEPASPTGAQQEVINKEPKKEADLWNSLLSRLKMSEDGSSVQIERDLRKKIINTVLGQSSNQDFLNMAFAELRDKLNTIGIDSTEKLKNEMIKGQQALLSNDKSYLENKSEKELDTKINLLNSLIGVYGNYKDNDENRDERIKLKLINKDSENNKQRVMDFLKSNIDDFSGQEKEIVQNIINKINNNKRLTSDEMAFVNLKTSEKNDTQNARPETQIENGLDKNLLTFLDDKNFIKYLRKTNIRNVSYIKNLINNAHEMDDDDKELIKNVTDAIDRYNKEDNPNQDTLNDVDDSKTFNYFKAGQKNSKNKYEEPALDTTPTLNKDLESEPKEREWKFSDVLDLEAIKQKYPNFHLDEFSDFAENYPGFKNKNSIAVLTYSKTVMFSGEVTKEEGKNVVEYWVKEYMFDKNTSDPNILHTPDSTIKNTTPFTIPDPLSGIEGEGVNTPSVESTNLESQENKIDNGYLEHEADIYRMLNNEKFMKEWGWSNFQKTNERVSYYDYYHKFTDGSGKVSTEKIIADIIKNERRCENFYDKNLLDYCIKNKENSRYKPFSERVKSWWNKELEIEPSLAKNFSNVLDKFGGEKIEKFFGRKKVQPKQKSEQEIETERAFKAETIKKIKAKLEAENASLSDKLKKCGIRLGVLKINENKIDDDDRDVNVSGKFLTGVSLGVLSGATGGATSFLSSISSLGFNYEKQIEKYKQYAEAKGQKNITRTDFAKAIAISFAITAGTMALGRGLRYGLDHFSVHDVAHEAVKGATGGNTIHEQMRAADNLSGGETLADHTQVAEVISQHVSESLEKFSDYTIKPGDNFTNILKHNLLNSENLARFKIEGLSHLTPFQQKNVIQNLLEKAGGKTDAALRLAAQLKNAGLDIKNPKLIFSGKSIDLRKVAELLKDTKIGDKNLLEHAMTVKKK